MQILNKDSLDIQTIKELAGILQEGGIGVWKTDTIYGYFARYDNLSSLEQISRLKKRKNEKFFSVAFAELENHLDWFFLTELQKSFLQNILPAPFTFVLAVRNLDLNEQYFDSKFLGVRIPAHPLTRNICLETGIPLVTTSANLSGGSHAMVVSEIPGYETGDIDFVIDTGKIEEPLASSVVKLVNDEYIFLREGAVSEEEFMKIWTKFKKEMQ